MSVSTHVLDTSVGRPAADVTVRLERRAGQDWVEVARAATDADGRAALLAAGAPMPAGVYRLTFDAGSHFLRRGVDAFYEEIAITFVVRDAASHYHVPLLVSPYGYSTYRGS
jgi:5-hydroxyisourate hydrolase